jgi:hypothetical protein
MSLFSLYYGKGKKKIKKLLMTDTFDKCEKYKKARENNVVGFHEIRPAEEGAKKKKKKSCTVGGNKPTGVPHINRHGKTVRNGYIDKYGFNPHT